MATLYKAISSQPESAGNFSHRGLFFFAPSLESAHFWGQTLFSGGYEVIRVEIPDDTPCDFRADSVSFDSSLGCFSWSDGRKFTTRYTVETAQEKSAIVSQIVIEHSGDNFTSEIVCIVERDDEVFSEENFDHKYSILAAKLLRVLEGFVDESERMVSVPNYKNWLSIDAMIKFEQFIPVSMRESVIDELLEVTAAKNREGQLKLAERIFAEVQEMVISRQEIPDVREIPEWWWWV